MPAFSGVLARVGSALLSCNVLKLACFPCNGGGVIVENSDAIVIEVRHDVL